MNNITAKIIADSISESGIRITTLELEFKRFLLAQFNAHRMFSRSAQSSRAVPVAKLIDNSKQSKPPRFMKNQSGMQSTEFFEDEYMIDSAEDAWNDSRSEAIRQAQRLDNMGVHKQFVNRLLEPFSTVKVVVTATEWQNFFDLRLHHAAQPEMQELSQAMKLAMDKSTPQLLENDEWHLPYVDYHIGDDYEKLALISAARCARVSYLNHDNSTPDIEKDLELAQRLLADKHLSPFEHQAKPMDFNADTIVNGQTHTDIGGLKWSGNFREWTQHRHLIEK